MKTVYPDCKNSYKQERSFSKDTRPTYSPNIEGRAQGVNNDSASRLQYDSGRKQDNTPVLQPPPTSRVTLLNLTPYTQEEALLQELKATREALHEKDYRLQHLEEANNRLLFRMRNLRVEIQGKEKTISELNQEINFMKRKLHKPTEIRCGWIVE